ncbi:MAG: trehalose-6-phosphate synthase [Proteobacteria bacterium]|nr:trehalose-6-phosphate synthase [Pseudomonadota bacterium]
MVSNREPYVHNWREGKISVSRPASGLVTAIDPMLRASRGTWIAHGSGNADRSVVDEKGRVKVPPGKDLYTLRRVWLTKEEEQGYYYGLSNETLWPLCHVAYARPAFKLADWEMYKKVNRRFADVVLEEIGDRKAFVWVQDYHFALLPAMLKEARPDIMVAQFWHIPWPNPEIFRICPWSHEILEGMLGNDLLGFHIRWHCDNFMNTVDLILESRIDRESSTVFHHGGLSTKVMAFPISVDYGQIEEDSQQDFSSNETVGDVMDLLPMKYEVMAVGIDRIDYTKGIPERLKAIDRYLEKHPEMIEKFLFVQIGSLSRIHIGLYKQLNDEINRLVEEINWKYSTEGWQPIVMLRRGLVYPEILAFYRMAKVCIVSSLHDGMNLVAKEYISSCAGGDGALVLSRFAGASRELDKGAIVINPYDTEAFADAIHEAVSMPDEERRSRMEKLRAIVSEYNIYRWAAKFMSELSKIA